MQCNEYVKFGISKNPEYRIKELQTGNPYKIKLLLKLEYDDYYGIENNIHRYFDKKREIGEWFLIDKDIKDFVKYLKNIEYELLKMEI
jgi:hypothetical protein